MSCCARRRILLVVVALLLGVIVGLITGILTAIGGTTVAGEFLSGGAAFSAAVPLALLLEKELGLFSGSCG